MTNFELVDRPAQPTAVVHERVPMRELHQFFARAFGQVFGVMQAQGVAPSGAVDGCGMRFHPRHRLPRLGTGLGTPMA